MGKIRAPYYRIVVVDSRTKRDGRSIEEIGKYHPTEEPSYIEVDSPRALYWLGVGAQPSPQVEAILKLTGDWGTFKGEKNPTNTVKTKESKAEFVADEKKKPVLKPKAEAPAPKAKVEEAAAEDAAPVEAAPEAPAAEAPAAEAPAAADEDAAGATGDDAAADVSTESPLAGSEDAVVVEAEAAADAEPDAKA
ncbi:MAG: ribosomal protein [Microbacteriaceae bacterium]|nr:ribosomal protein [Microbacteriaceae bacterium]